MGREAYPEKQQYATIWDYQARMVLGLVDELELDTRSLAGGCFQGFLERMENTRLPSV